ncbi:helix-turn-helix transcriptional regulator [Roseovarius dicentrarchi]|uniref:helix-turn-helix transcriptional regulator n=1 Tax=Roseovarius dicentrarchi TaxID=2250573 RepID=UPI000DE995C1|nr:autoinducer binding domain-containing protein [Roseovarius dicentrarchi]
MIALGQSPLDAILERLQTAHDVTALQRAIETCRDHFAIEHAVYHWVSAAGHNYGVYTYPKAWIDHYMAHDYLRIDPVILGCYSRFHPVDWKQLDWSSRSARLFRQQAADHGLGTQGYSVPIRGPHGQFALFTVSHTCDDAAWARFTDANWRSLILIAHAFNQKALEFEPSRTPDGAAPLSPREVDALSLLALGYSRAQVAKTLTISEHTLRAYIETARHKLGAANTVNAVALALARGAIMV